MSGATPAAPQAVRDDETVTAESQWQLIRKRFSRHKLAMGSLWLLAVLYLTTILAGFIAPYGKNFRDLDYIYAPPQLPAWSWSEGWHAPALERHFDPINCQVHFRADPSRHVPLGFFVQGEPYKLLGLIPCEHHLFGVDLPAYRERFPEATDEPRYYFLGADRFGHDLFSRLVHGARVSLFIGIIAIIITFALGVSIGGVSGYVGGRTDNVIQRGIEIINSFPQLPLWLALAAAMPGDWSALQVYFAITIVLALLSWTGLARQVRGKILALREEDYVTAARLLGASHGRIIGQHLIPGFTSHIIVVLTLAVPGMILGETALSFLGLGLRPPVVSWGVLLQDCTNMQTLESYPWLLLPVLPIVLTVLAFNFLGDGLRDAADPYAAKK